MVSAKDMTLRTSSNSTDGTLSNELIHSPDSNSMTARTTSSDVESDLGTLIINDETDDEDSDKTLKPAFLQHFEQKENMVSNVSQFILFYHLFCITFIAKSQIK